MTTLAQSCFHCGLPVPAGSAWSVVIEDVAQPMCCPGCEAVAQAIIDNDLTDYYRTRQSLPEGAAEIVPDALGLYDAPELASQFQGENGKAEATLSIEGIRCAACVWLIEKRLSQVPGLQFAHLNVATEKLQVSWDAAQCKPSDILEAVREVGYVAYPFDPIQHGEMLRKNARQMFKRLFVAGLSMMQVMMYAVPVYFAEAGSIETDMVQLMRWASLVLTLPAVFYSAQPFFQGAWADLRRKVAGMDVPVALGIAAAFAGSVWSTVAGEGEVYFDSVTMFIFLLLASRYLELVARRRAAASLETMQHALPDAAWLLKDYPNSREASQVPAAQLRAGDVILAKPGDPIAADSVIIEGDTALDMSLLTGESQPQARRIGEQVVGGAVNMLQPVILRVERVAKESTLAALIRMIERAGQGKPAIAHWADKVAAWFVAALLVLAVAVLSFWLWHDPVRAWPIAIAVLVVSCPCALSLATPSALAAATDRLLRQGVLIMQPHVLETLHRATHVVFDKTGTLTEGRPQLQAIDLLGNLPRDTVLGVAAAMEAGSAHPLAQAIIFTARTESVSAIEIDRVTHHAGQGLEVRMDDQPYRLGTAAFVAEISGSVKDQMLADDMSGVSYVYLGSSSGWLARFAFVDTLKPRALQVVTHFRSQGSRVVLLSGDSPAIVQQVAASLQMDEAHGGMLPDQKLAYVQQLQQQGAVVVMVGDGMNDAAVLRGADVSFAMGSGAALAQSHADAVLIHAQLSLLLDAADAAATCMRVIRQNLAWATLYNLLAIPAAAFGLLTPWMAGLGMSLSSAFVVVNALRLERMPLVLRKAH
ncbi:ZntA Cation transport ATPase [Oxalobacteraceae bacterium]